MKTKIIQSIIVVVAFAVFGLAVFLGFNAGKTSAMSAGIIKNAKQQVAGFEYFKADQDRYPSEFEYANQDLMSLYFSVFPPAKFVTNVCPKNFAYKSADSKTYELDFCLPRALGGYKAGWNALISADAH